MTSQDTLAKVAQSAWRIRRYAVRMGEVQGQGYVGKRWGMPMYWPPHMVTP